MYKKLLLILLVMVLAISSVFAVPFKFVFGYLGQHPEILMGFIPTYILAGAGYRGIELIEEDVTELQALLGFGYNQRKVCRPSSMSLRMTTTPIRAVPTSVAINTTSPWSIPTSSTASC